VKPYVKRGKTDASDAEAICEAVTRPTMRYVAIKSPEQQAALAIHRTPDLFVKQRTQLVNMIRGLLAEFGIDIRRGIGQALILARHIDAGDMLDMPAAAAKKIAGLAGQILDLRVWPREIEGELLAWQRSNYLAKRLATIDTVCATALAASVKPAPVLFRPAVCCLARAYPAPALEWRQGTAGADLKDGRQISAQTARRRHDLARSAPGSPRLDVLWSVARRRR
jgi:transposase